MIVVSRSEGSRRGQITEAHMSPRCASARLFDSVLGPATIEMWDEYGTPWVWYDRRLFWPIFVILSFLALLEALFR